MPLTEKVTFKAKLQKGNRIQVPKLYRWRYKLETHQILKGTLNPISLWGAMPQFFLARMSRDGRIIIPKLTQTLLKGDKPDIEGCVLHVTIEPS
jgi:hypothetical protein